LAVVGVLANVGAVSGSLSLTGPPPSPLARPACPIAGRRVQAVARLARPRGGGGEILGDLNPACRPQRPSEFVPWTYRPDDRAGRGARHPWTPYLASISAPTAPTRATPLIPPPERTRSARFLAAAVIPHLLRPEGRRGPPPAGDHARLFLFHQLRRKQVSPRAMSWGTPEVHRPSRRCCDGKGKITGHSARSGGHTARRLPCCHWTIRP
jgi:hypothetical protein